MIDDKPAATTPVTKRQPDGSWTPVILSVVVYPGIGQWMQKRYVSGSVYGIIFGLMAVLFAVVFYQYLRDAVAILHAALEGRTEGPTSLPPLKIIIQPFVMVLFIYLANVVDVLRGRLQVRTFLAQK